MLAQRAVADSLVGHSMLEKHQASPSAKGREERNWTGNKSSGYGKYKILEHQVDELTRLRRYLSAGHTYLWEIVLAAEEYANTGMSLLRGITSFTVLLDLSIHAENSVAYDQKENSIS